MSVLFNKYYPHLSRYYDLWTYQPFFAGVTTDKNLLGMTLYVSGVYLCWETMTLRKEIGRKLSLKDWFAQLLMISMTVWLLSKAHSSTALACTVLGSALMLAFRIPFVRRASGRLSIYGVAGALLLAGLNSAFDLDEKIVRLLGRDMTFTGRTEIWQAVLDENTNPIFGCGFYSFWSEKRVERLSEDHYFHLNSAHNAYLETYLNTGAIGLLLLIGVFGHSIFRISEEVKRGSSYAAFRLAVVFSIATYGMTEAIFNRLGPIWMLLLLVVIEYRQPQRLGPAADVAAY